MGLPRPPTFESYSHDPAAILDYPFEWGAKEDKDGNPIKSWLETGDSIATATVVVAETVLPKGVEDDETPLTVGVITIDAEGVTVLAWISGGTLGAQYTVTNHIVTTDGREEDKSIILVVQQH